MFRLFALTAPALVLTGCVSLPRPEVDRRGAQRDHVDFENTDAARLFAEASKTDSNRDETEHWLLAALLDKRFVRTSEAARFNYTVERCDTNGDRTISYAEAWYYWNLMK